MHKIKLKKILPRLIYTIVGIAILTTLYYFVIGFSLNNPGHIFNKGHNAIWIGHKWIGEEHSQKEIINLVKDFQEHDIDLVFVHSGPLLKNGSVDTKLHSNVTKFLQIAKPLDTDIKYQAWLGQVRNKIDLSSTEVRNNISSVALLLTESVGFDGIHYDIEPIRNNDEDFLLLLLETKNKLKSDKKMSVAVSELIPKSVVWFLQDIYEFTNYNSEKNLKQIAEIADQIVLMIYDTGTPKKWLYTWLVKEQVVRTSKLIPNDKELYIAIPTYDKPNDGFNPEVENISSALQGVINGLNDLRSNSDSFTGIALYANWTTDALEWESYSKLFQKN